MPDSIVTLILWVEALLVRLLVPILFLFGIALVLYFTAELADFVSRVPYVDAPYREVTNR